MNRTGGVDDRRIEDRDLLHGHLNGFEVGFHRFKNLPPEIVLLKQMSECQDCVLVRDPVVDQGDAGKAAHHRHLNQPILHR